MRCRAASACTLLMPGTTSYSKLELAAREDLLDDRERAVVERGIAPDEERAALAGRRARRAIAAS